MPEAVHIPWQPIGGGRASEAIYDQLRELITSGVLKPGDRLPSERAMMEQLHRSRPTIREALRMLEQGGYVASTHGASGAVVQELTIDGVEQPLSAMLQLNQISLEELGEYRAVNDGTIAGWAARRRTDRAASMRRTINAKRGMRDIASQTELARRIGMRAGTLSAKMHSGAWTAKDLAALDSCLTAAEQALGDYRRFAELDVRFHSLLSRATGNQVAMIVTDVLGQVEQHTLLKKMETLNDGACLALERRILARHREILSAIHRQDDAAAKQAMREHTRAAATDLKV